jgi:hypothetical protein
MTSFIREFLPEQEMAFVWIRAGLRAMTDRDSAHKRLMERQLAMMCNGGP